MLTRLIRRIPPNWISPKMMKVSFRPVGGGLVGAKPNLGKGSEVVEGESLIFCNRRKLMKKKNTGSEGQVCLKKKMITFYVASSIHF